MGTQHGISEPLAGLTAIGGRVVCRVSAGWDGEKRDWDAHHSNIHNVRE